MKFKEAKEIIESLGWHVIAQKKHPDGMQFDATNYKRLAKSEICGSSDQAMESCLNRVLTFVQSSDILQCVSLKGEPKHEG